ncbi:MAG: hypothetical protein K1W35_15570 [Lachnospiraceae bacterium]
MKKKLTLFCITIIAVLSVGVKYSENNKELPPVLFSYLYKNTRYCSVWTIDNEGNIYRFHDHYGEYLDMTDYEHKKKDKTCKYIKSIDEETLKEKYYNFREIISDGRFEKNMHEVQSDEDGIAITDSLYRGIRDSYGYVYNRKGEQEYILMHGAGDLQFISEDSRMKELADWIMELIQDDIKEYDEYCKQLAGEEYYNKYIQDSQVP